MSGNPGCRPKTSDRTMNGSPNRLPRPRSVLHWIAFGAGAGLAPRAPGTAGTAVAIPIYAVLATQSITLYLLAVTFIAAAGVWVCGRTARELGVHDHPGIVLDEIAGFLVTMTALPFDWPWIRRRLRGVPHPRRRQAVARLARRPQGRRRSRDRARRPARRRARRRGAPRGAVRTRRLNRRDVTPFSGELVVANAGSRKSGLRDQHA